MRLALRRSLSIACAAVALALGACAMPTLAKSPACVPQPQLGKLEPLEIVTGQGRARLLVEVADSPRERERGMMCRTAMAADRGMLFDFKTPQPVAFWMENTLISLDMVFIRADGRVLSIQRNARPLDRTPLPAGGVVLGVLEIPGGRAAQLGVLPGDQVIHRIFPK
ncbi:DUF192 domain-containing protein [Phenylobacterium sp.]|uniref:DUF192 domain-containing protein n=1 Tax=Phenylobacterium sp. TaxID=1871053 RepID=UPI003525B64F